MAMVGCAANKSASANPPIQAKGSASTASTANPDVTSSGTGAKSSPDTEPAEAPAEPGPGQSPDSNVKLTAVDGSTGMPVNLSFEPIYFDFDKYEVKSESMPAIRHNAEILAKNPTVHIVIEGNCDERGTTEYNLALGQERAVAVYRALKAESIAASRMKTISYGKERPVDPGHTEQAWAKNRRDSFRTS